MTALKLNNVISELIKRPKIIPLIEHGILNKTLDTKIRYSNMS